MRFICTTMLFMLMGWLNTSGQVQKPFFGMWMETPANDWHTALPTGNGDMGAMIYGGIARERILINHKQWFFRKNHKGKNIPDFSVNLPAMRVMMQQGKYKEAEDFYLGKVKESGYASTSAGEYQSGFDLNIAQTSGKEMTGYQRKLNFENGEATVCWSDGGNAFTRSLFVSRADDVVVLRILSSGKKSVSADFTLAPHDLKDAVNKNGLVPKEKLGLKFEEPQITGDGYILIKATRNDDGQEFGAVARVVQQNGKAEVKKSADDIVYSVSGADEIVVLLKMFYSGNGQEQWNSLKRSLQQMKTDYQSLLSEHTRVHRELFLRARLDLNGGAQRQWSNEQLLADAERNGMSNALSERMFDYGRYLLISSSNPGGLPANLQGVWNGLYYAPWQGSFFLNENLQMNYWQALQGNVPELMLSVFNLMEGAMPDFRTNARQYFGTRGILCPIRMIPGYGLKTKALTQDIFWTGGAGWMGQFYFDYWLFTRDDHFLRTKAIPYMKEVALFYEDFAQQSSDGKLLMMPSNSPENIATGQKGQVSINSTIDFAIMKELLSNLIQACEYLKIEPDGVARWKNMLNQIPDYQINEDGAIKEWMHPDFKDNYHHRHQSHLYPVFPGMEITRSNNPALFEGFRTAVEKRLVVGLSSQTGWSLSHMANIYARLNEGERAWECLNLVIDKKTGENLFTYHDDYESSAKYENSTSWPQFQVDASLGWSAAVIEMLVFSNQQLIRLLPALPEKWDTGKIGGIRCRGNFTIGLDWKEGKLTGVTITSHSGMPVQLAYGEKAVNLNIPKGKTVRYNANLEVIN